ncbi:MAG: tetratricopeptide repeat protein [Pseudomonadota bacterium]
MARSNAPVPEAVRHSIAKGRYAEAAEALRTLAEQEPSPAVLLALSDMEFQLGRLSAAKAGALRAVEVAPGEPAPRALLARVRVALDEPEAALVDFSAALERALPPSIASSGNAPIAVPAHQALHNLEQLAYLEQVGGLPPGTLLPAASLRDMARSKLNQMLANPADEIPAIPLAGQYGRLLADPPLVIHDEAPPAVCLNPRNDWGDVVQAFTGKGKGVACVDGLLTPEALAQLQRFCLRSTVWRRPYPPGYIGASPESGFYSALLLQIATELRQAVPELLDGHHLNYWWSFVCQHQRPGIDIHADQSDISLNLWITPDHANLQPGTGGLDVWDVAAPDDWSYDDYNSGHKDIRAYLHEQKARKTPFAYGENRALLFRGSIFHETAPTRFAAGFENRRRNVTMLFRRTRG